ncbi:PLAT domain-containing protein 3-like [Arachis stenosperma]|uniref:PLAT domain-containing protein 3-like n=1 Tax=Arachis stenosperma TaxID=217475 RepID=UPI0025AC763C|nr:PLAT domain-containing protein 3-like [Arachis stenosperma]
MCGSYTYHISMASSTAFFSLLFLLSLSFAATIRSDPDAECVFTVYVRTGSVLKGGTDSKIGLKLYDKYGYYIYINNLQAWGGLMGKNYNYFERGNLDIFSGRGPCLESPVCAVNVTSDGAGSHHGWYCNYVEVTTTGPHVSCNQEQFEVEQWLADDTVPYQLWAARNKCRYSLDQARPRPNHGGASLSMSL